MSGPTPIDTTSTSAAEIKLNKILNAPSAPPPGTINFRKWFLQQFMQRDNPHCPLEKFASYFFDAVRQQTYIHLHTTEATESSCIKPDEIDLLRKKPTPTILAGSLDAHNKEMLTALEAQSYPSLGTPCSRSFTQVLPRNASTPARRNLNHTQHHQHKHTHTQSLHGSQNPRRSMDNGNKSFGATSNNSSYDKSRNSTGDGSVGSNSFCLGDFLTSPSVSNRHSSAQKKKQQSSSTSAPSNSNGSKPKKRVVPISVSKSVTTAAQGNAPFGANSSFSQENNILTLSQTEIKDFNKCAVAEAHKALKNDLSEVNFALKASTPASTPTKTRASDVKKPPMQKQEVACSRIGNTDAYCPPEPFVLDRIPSDTIAQLKMLASIYGLLVDMNLTTNVLQEISFLLSLLNTNVPTETLQHLEKPTKSDKELLQTSFEERPTKLENRNALELLKEVTNSIFFAIRALEDQQHTLALIDTKSLGVILQCERLVSLSPGLKTTLTEAYGQKQAFSIMKAHDISLGGGLKNVCFQEDSDSRKFFQNNSEFGAFKSQRDLFYNALKLWEKHHLFPSWNFAIEISPKVREIFRQSENPINMTHFAKLFVAQLLISATEQPSPEEVGIGTDDVDLEKFNKLAQRLVAPSDFSVDYQFPREQAFFRDFIIESRSVPFMEHLKIVLFSELVTLNDSTFEQLNLLAEDVYRESIEENEFIVKPAVLGSMLVLAKFLGFVTALPFQSSNSNEVHPAIIQSYQLRLRRLFQPSVNICQLLETAVRSGRHLITLPWIVQYLAMLDDVTLQLESFVEATQKLFDLYTALGNGELKITSISAFIVRCCLGWLFEQKPVIGTEYLNYRVTHEKITKALSEPRNELVKSSATTFDVQVKSMLESILCVACPFLAEFRVSIMPAKHAMAKYVSRSGRFRHITPCIADSPRSGEQNLLHPSALSAMDASVFKNLPTTETASKKRQQMLMESFLHAQNSSMRRLVIFLSERVYKCVVKDAQYKILLPSKAAADAKVNEITSSNKKEVMEQVKTIYQNARSEACKQWDTQIPEMLNIRTNHSLEALLPIETVPIVKKAYAWRIRSDAKMKIEQWRHMNLYKNDFYCSDVYELTGKICKANANRIKSSDSHTTGLKLVRSQPRISDLIEEMQHWLYTTGFETSFQPGLFSTYSTELKVGSMPPCQLDLALIDFLKRLKASFDNTLPTIYYRLIGAGLVQLLQHLISKSPTLVTVDLIQAACEFFSNDNIRNADVAPTPTKDNKAKTITEDADSSELNISSTESTTTTIYHALITAPFVESLGSCHVRYEKLKNLLFAMMQSGVITLDFINTLFVTVFKEDLTVSVLNAVSKMLYDLAKISTKKTKRVDSDSDSDSDMKSQLFMEVLADFSRDLDEL